MRTYSSLLCLAFAVSFALPALAEDDYRHDRDRHGITEPHATIGFNADFLEQGCPTTAGSL